MLNDQDPNLSALFAQAEQEFDQNRFVADVMQQIDKERRKTLFIWMALALFILACCIALATPVMAAFSMATQLLPTSLVDVQSEWLQQLVSPINSVAAAVALLVLGVLRFYRKVLR